MGFRKQILFHYQIITFHTINIWFDTPLGIEHDSKLLINLDVKIFVYP